MLRDHYKTLGVARDADLATIKKECKRLRRKYHPDIPENAGDPKIEEKAKEIGEACSVLCDAKSRSDYDKYWNAEHGGTAYDSPSGGYSASPTPNLKANPSHIAFGDVVLGSTRSKIITVRNVGYELDNPSIGITFDPLIEGFEWECIPSSAANPFPLKITVTYSCSPETTIGAISTELVVSLSDVSLKVPVACNIIAEDITFSTYSDTPDVADDEVFDDDDSDYDGDDDSAPDFAAGGTYGSPSSTPPPSSTASSGTAYSTVSAPFASAPIAKKGWFWKLVGSYFVAQFYYALVALLIGKVLPVIIPHPPAWIVAVIGTWLFVSTLFIGAITFFAWRGNSAKASGVREWLLYSTVGVMGLVAITAITMRITAAVEQHRIANKMLVSQKSGFVIPPNTIIFDDFNNDTGGSDHGITYGVSQVGRHGFHYAAFTEDASSRIEYPNGIPDQGTLEFWIYVTDGYYWHDSQYHPQQQQAMIFSTDAYGGDVTWPGTAHLAVSSNGDVSFYLAENLGGNPPTPSLEAKNTGFRFNEWHAIGISYGSENQSVMVDGKEWMQPGMIQKLGAAGDHLGPLDIPTIGETVSHFWPRHAYDGGFEGFVGLFRASSVQQDWHFARGINESYFTAPQTVRQPQISAEDQREHQLVQQAQTLFAARNYDAALADCNEALVLNAGDQTAIQLKSQIQQAMQPTGTGTDSTTNPPGTTTAGISTPPSTPATSGLQTSGTAQTPLAPQSVTIQQWLTLANGQFERDDLKGALQSCNAALQIDPHNDDAIRLKGKIENTMKILGSPSTAQAPSAPQAMTVQQWLALAERQFEGDNFKGALQSCNAALQIDPQNNQAVQLKGKIAATTKVLGDTQ
jgi:hypothetical protein